MQNARRGAYDSAKGRRFALTIAAAFAAIALLAIWRDRDLIAMVTGGLSAALILSGLVIPGKLEPVERLWMRFAHGISRVTTPVFMGIVYFLVLTPAGVIRRTFGADPLVRRPDEDSYWVMRPEREPEARRRRMERQF